MVSPYFSIIEIIFSRMGYVPNKYPPRSCPFTARTITDFHKGKLFRSSFNGELKFMTFPNRELLSTMKGYGISVLRVNGIESAAIPDGEGGRDGESTMI